MKIVSLEDVRFFIIGSGDEVHEKLISKELHRLIIENHPGFNKSTTIKQQVNKKLDFSLMKKSTLLKENSEEEEKLPEKDDKLFNYGSQMKLSIGQS